MKPNEDATRKLKYNRIWAILIGFGVALSPIHNSWLTRLVTSEDVVGFFIPAFGIAIWFMGTLAFALYNWSDLSWGDKRVYIPLLIIVVAMGLSGITADKWGDKVSPLFMGIALFVLYMVSRKLGKDMFLPLAIGVVLASLGVIVLAVIIPGKLTGGLLFEGNYDVVVGYVLLGTMLFIHRWQWILAGLSLVAMFLTGSPEGVFTIFVVGLVILARRDWSRKLLYVLGAVVAIMIMWVSLGWGQSLYGYAKNIATRDDPTVPYIENEKRSAIGYRLYVIQKELSDLQPFGDGYSITDFNKNPIHNVPLIIVQQLGWAGIIAALAWLWVAIYCLAKTRWKYAWVVLLSLCVFDHFIWSQLCPLFWCLVGVSTASAIKNDLIFRENKLIMKYNHIKEVFNG